MCWWRRCTERKRCLWCEKYTVNEYPMNNVISKPLAKILTTLTHEPRLDVAVMLAVKDWLRLRLQAIELQKHAFEEKYGMDFFSFREAWHAGEIPDRYSYEVEKDYWEWEGLLTDEKELRAMAELI